MKTVVRAFTNHTVFDDAIAALKADGTLASLGTAEMRLGIEVVDDDGDTTLLGLCFSGDDVSAIGPVTEAWFDPEVILSADACVWEEMVAVIARDGKADLTHTINTLSLADTPISVRSHDAMGHDKLYRFMGSVQAIFDALGRIQVA